MYKVIKCNEQNTRLLTQTQKYLLTQKKNKLEETVFNVDITLCVNNNTERHKRLGLTDDDECKEKVQR